MTCRGSRRPRSSGSEIGSFGDYRQLSKNRRNVLMDRALSPLEIRLMARQMESVATYPTIRLALRMILLTLVRRSERIQATWDEVDFENATWTRTVRRLTVEHVFGTFKPQARAPNSRLLENNEGNALGGRIGTHLRPQNGLKIAIRDPLALFAPFSTSSPTGSNGNPIRQATLWRGGALCESRGVSTQPRPILAI